MKAPSFRSRQTRRFVRVSLIWLSATLAGGTVFGTCDIRLHDSLISGTKLWLSQLLDPTNITFTADDGTNSAG